jgi:hypothetical protein
MREYIESEQKIVNKLRSLTKDYNSDKIKVLELGMGNKNCRYSRMLRKAFPNSFILAFELPPKTVNHETLSIVDEVKVGNINSKRFKNYKEEFDIVTFGSHRLDAGFHFGFLTQKIYTNALQSLDYYLKPSGYFVGILKSKKISNIKQQNFFDRRLDQDVQIKQKKHLSFDEIPSLTNNILDEIGDYKFEELLVEDEDIVNQDNRVGCLEMLKTRLDLNLIAEDYYHKWFERCKEIDLSLKTNGESWGYFKIQTAKKGMRK